MVGPEHVPSLASHPRPGEHHFGKAAILWSLALIITCVGTTAASLILVRPIIRANQDRAYNAHVFVFFIFLVANIGGSLTPLGDPSLFVGFLKGVDFLWPLEHMLAPMLLASGVLLALFYVVDRLVWSRESEEVRGKRRVRRQIRIEGVHNRIYLGVVAVTVLASGIWGDSTTEPIGIGIEMP